MFFFKLFLSVLNLMNLVSSKFIKPILVLCCVVRFQLVLKVCFGGLKVQMMQGTRNLGSYKKASSASKIKIKTSRYNLKTKFQKKNQRCLFFLTEPAHNLISRNNVTRGRRIGRVGTLRAWFQSSHTQTSRS